MYLKAQGVAASFAAAVSQLLSALLYLIVLHYPPKLTWVPSGPLDLCDLFNAREPVRRGRPVRRNLFNAREPARHRRCVQVVPV